MDDELNALKTVPPFLQDASYLPRITRQSGRVLEEALAPSTLFDQGAQLQGGIIEATYAADEPPILKRLRGTVPYLVDHQLLRFAGDGFLDTATFSKLPYRPDHVIDAENVKDIDAPSLTREVLKFEQDQGCAAFISPAWPLFDQNQENWLTANRHLWAASCDANGNGEIEKRAMLAQVAPGKVAMDHPDTLIETLMDLPFDGVYVQPLRLNPTKDSVEKLLRFVKMLEGFEEAGLPVVAARVGAFGVLLTALGISAFDSGLGIAEASDVKTLIRKRKPPKDDEKKKGPRGIRRVYLEPLKTTMAARQAKLILEHPQLRAKFACDLGCCRFQGLEELAERSRPHYLWTRNDEVRDIRDLGTPSMKLDFVHEQLRDAREMGRLVRRTLIGNLKELPSFDHTDRWIRVLAREVEARAVA